MDFKQLEFNFQCHLGKSNRGGPLNHNGYLTKLYGIKPLLAQWTGLSKDETWYHGTLGIVS